MFVEGNERLSIRKGFQSSNGINFQRAPLPPPCQSVPPSIEPLPAALPAFPAPPCGKFSNAIELELINNTDCTSSRYPKDAGPSISGKKIRHRPDLVRTFWVKFRA